MKRSVASESNLQSVLSSRNGQKSDLFVYRDKREEKKSKLLKEPKKIEEED